MDRSRLQKAKGLGEARIYTRVGADASAAYAVGLYGDKYGVFERQVNGLTFVSAVEDGVGTA